MAVKQGRQHVKLFGNSLVLSGTAPMEALTAEVLAEKLLFFSRHAVAISGKINEVPAADAQETVVDSPFDANFISV